MNPVMAKSAPTAIPDDVLKAAREGLYAAWDEHAALFNPLSNSISEGLWDRFIEASARAIMAAEKRAEARERERCAAFCEKEADDWYDEGETGRAVACYVCADAIRQG